MAELELKHHARKVGVNVHHFEWCTKYRCRMLRQDKYREICEQILRDIAEKHGIVIRELGVMPEHIHMSVEIPPLMSQSKALQPLKGGLSHSLFRAGGGRILLLFRKYSQQSINQMEQNR